MMTKKLTSLALALVMCLSLCVPAFAAGQDSTTRSEDNYHAEIQWNTNTDFTITGYVDGQMIDRVSGGIGGSTLSVQTFENQKSNDGETATTRVVLISDIVAPMDGELLWDGNMPVTTRAYNSYAGSVQFRVLGSAYYYYTLYVYYDLVDTNSVTHYQMNAENSERVSVILGALIAATGAAFSLPITVAILTFLGGVVGSGRLLNDISGEFNGTLYDYNTKVQDARSNPARYETYSGQRFLGNFRKGTSAWKAGEAYGDYYPQFIREQDSAVAGWIFPDFYAELTYDVYTWNSNI